ncbi:MAG: hypothetical protein IKU25_00310 [Clostridia bacterium]|nr:hypothetical protein [Clostridia bacterium]
MEGWIRIQRTITEHWIWNDPVKLKWWLDLLMLANYSETKVNVGLQIYECGRGEVISSLGGLAKRWGVTKDRVRNFLVLLEKDAMISHESYTKFTRITICNYDSYQTDLHDNQTIAKRSPNDCQTIAKRSIYIKEKKNIKENPLSKDKGQKKVDEQLSPSNSAEFEASIQREKLPSKEIKDIWNECCPSFPKLLTISENRKNKMRNRIAEMGGAEKALEILKGIFQKMESSAFLKGDNKRGWKASFDWLFENDKNWVKVWEGNYDSNNHSSGSKQSSDVNDIWNI